MPNIVAWSVTFKWEINTKDLLLNHILTKVKDWVWNIFVYWETELQKTSIEVFEFIKKRITGIISKYDISISTEDTIVLKISEQMMWGYECNVIEWTGVDFNKVLDDISDDSNVIAVREAENGVIKVDKIV